MDAKVRMAPLRREIVTKDWLLFPGDGSMGLPQTLVVSTLEVPQASFENMLGCLVLVMEGCFWNLVCRHLRRQIFFNVLVNYTQRRIFHPKMPVVSCLRITVPDFVISLGVPYPNDYNSPISRPQLPFIDHSSAPIISSL